MSAQGYVLDAQTAARLVGLGVPLLVALLAKRHAPPWVKGLLNGGLALVGSTVGYLVAVDGGYDWRGWLEAFLAALTASAASYLVIWRHTLCPAIQGGTAGFGVGPASAPATPGESPPP